MSAQLPARDILAFNMYQEIQVSKYLNGLYDFLFLGEYDRNIQGSNTITSEFKRYESEFKKASEESSFKLTETLLLNTNYKLLPTKKDSSLNFIEDHHNNYDVPEKLRESILYLLFNKYQNYNLLTQLRDPSKLIIIPDYYESNTTSLKDYFTDINLKDSLKDKVPEIIKNHNEENVFFLKVFLKSDMDKKRYQEIIQDEFKRLESFLQQQFAIAISDLSKQTENPKKPFKEMIFLVNNKGEITDDYYKSNAIKSKYLEIVNTELIKFLNDNKNANINIGIQRKKLNNKVFINPFYTYTFKQINSENNILKLIKARQYKELKKSEDVEQKIKNNLLTIYFVHFAINEIYKEFFDKKYKIDQITSVEEKQDAFLNVYFRYHILSDDDEYDLKKIVFNSSYKCQLEIDELPNYKISGHFKSKSKYYIFKVTYIDPIDFEVEENKILLTMLFEEIKDTINRKGSDFITDFLKKRYKSLGLDETDYENNLFKQPSVRTFITNLYNIDKLSLQTDIDAINSMEINTTTNTLPDRLLNIIEKYDEIIEIPGNDYKNALIHSLGIIKKILEKLSKLPNYREILFFMLNHDDLKLRINKTNYTFNFTVLDKINENKITVYQDKFYGIIKKYKTTHYYEEFSLNRINNTLGDNKKIYFYEDLYITRDILINYLKQIGDYDEKIKARKQIPYKLLKILNNNISLNNLFLYIYENNRANVYIDNESADERKKESSDFNVFRKKAIESLINIIFTAGTPFYISRIDRENKNSTSKINYASYTIDKINNLNYITEYTKESEWESFVNKNYFYGSIEDSKKILKKYDNNFLNNTEITNNSMLSKKNKKDTRRFISYNNFKKNVDELITKRDKPSSKDEDNRTIVILDFDLIPSNLVGVKQTCKTRKKRIGNKLWQMFKKQMQKANIFTRKLKNKFKTTRRKRNMKNNKIRTRENTKPSADEVKRDMRMEQNKRVNQKLGKS